MLTAKIYCPFNGRTAVHTMKGTKAELMAYATQELIERAETFGFDCEVYESDGWVRNVAFGDQWEMEILE